MRNEPIGVKPALRTVLFVDEQTTLGRARRHDGRALRQCNGFRRLLHRFRNRFAAEPCSLSVKESGLPPVSLNIRFTRACDVKQGNGRKHCPRLLGPISPKANDPRCYRPPRGRNPGTSLQWRYDWEGISEA